MTSTVSSFFSKDRLLGRHSRTTRTRKPTPLSAKVSPSIVISKPLQMITEEDSYEFKQRSTPRSPSPTKRSPSGSQTLGVTNAEHRQHAPILDDASNYCNTSLSSPRPAPQPPTTLPHSPDSFDLAFTDVAYRFPQPPSPTRFSKSCPDVSSPPSMTHSPSSSVSEFLKTPRTSQEGSRSDDEVIAPPSPRFIPQRVSIKPLRIVKHKHSPYKASNDLLTNSFIEPLNSSHSVNSTQACDSDSEPDSDSEWYSREFSNILTLRSSNSFSSCSCSTLSSCARPDSLPPTPHNVSSRSPLSPTRHSTRRSPLAGAFPSAQLDPDFPRRRSSSKSLAKSTPPVPPIPTHLRSSSAQLDQPQTPTRPSRRPPRSSVIPADCLTVGSLESSILGEHVDERLSGSSWSFTSDDLIGDRENLVSPTLDTSGNSRIPLLPLPLPTSPINLEADIRHGLEALRAHDESVPFPSSGFEPWGKSARISSPSLTRQSLFRRRTKKVTKGPTPPALQPLQPPRSTTAPVIVPVQEAETEEHMEKVPSKEENSNENNYSQRPALRSYWSTSTIASVKDDQPSQRHRRASSRSKLRSYFGVGSSASSSTAPASKPKKERSTSPTKKAGTTPMADLPTSPISPSMFSPTSSAFLDGRSRGSMRHGRKESESWEYGGAVRRRGSWVNSLISDAGSEESASSTGSTSLKRKPIPVEMFLRSSTLLTV
ncbi:hypothetical protein AX16_010460 [Volvariella volvacea WC 439]|nr:hypothetical protein AX16_010460 [Volvariella volvacea WC 439]